MCVYAQGPNRLITSNNNNNKIENDAGMVTPRQPLGHERRPGQQWMLASREAS